MICIVSIPTIGKDGHGGEEKEQGTFPGHGQQEEEGNQIGTKAKEKGTTTGKQLEKDSIGMQI